VLFMTPGRYRETELKVEAAYSTLGLFSLSNDIIILKFLKQQESLRKLRNIDLPPSNSIKYLTWLSVLQYSELCLEIAAKHKWNARGKWIVVFAIELFKCILKFFLLRSLNGHTLVNNSVPQLRDVALIKDLLAQHQQEQSRKQRATKKREKRIVSYEKWEQFKLQVRSTDAEMNRTYMFPAPFGETLAEMLNILRPIVYLVSMYRYGRQSWKAWIFSLMMDVFSLAYYSGRGYGISNNQRDEVSRRSTLLFYYLLRSPFFEIFTQRTPRPVKAIAGKFGSVPGLKSIFGSLFDFLSVYREHYFYTSGT